MMSDDYQWHFDYTRLVRDTGFTFQIAHSKPSITNDLAHIDIENVIRHQDIELIDRNINAVLEFHLDTSSLDPNVVKIFSICQLAVQYLLFCKKYLDNTVAYLKKEVAAAKLHINSLHSYAEQLQHEAITAKNEIKQLQTTLNCQTACTQNVPLFPCNQCSKAFSSEEYLVAHVQRRHENVVKSTSFQLETDKLQLEIKALKERLNNTEKYIHSDDDRVTSIPKVATPENSILSELQHKFELLKVHVDNELRILQTQKFDQDKYEQWFETFLNKLNSEKRTQCTGTGDLPISTACQTKEDRIDVVLPKKVTVSHDGTTQTDIVSIAEGVCSNCEQCSVHQSPQYQNGYFGDRELQPHFEKLGEMIQECVTGSMEKIENQVQTFCDKLKFSAMTNDKDISRPSSITAVIHKEDKLTGIHDGCESQRSLVPNDLQSKIVPSDMNVREISAHGNYPKDNETEIKVVPKPRKKWNTSTPMTPEAVPIAVKSPNENFSNAENTTPDNPMSDSGGDTVDSIQNVTVAPIDPIVETKVFDSISDTSESEDRIGNEEGGTDDTIETDQSNDPVFQTKRSILPTLDKRSPKKVALTPAVLGSVKKEVESLLDKQLTQLGVSPEWSSIPKQSYERVLKIVMHQSNLIKKRYPGYKKISEDILKQVDSQLLEQEKKNEVKRQKPSAKMYESVSDTDTDDTIRNRKKLVWGKGGGLNQTQRKYYNVIQEFNKKNKQSSSPELNLKPPYIVDDKMEQAKSALKNYPSVASLHKKKVIFNLATSEGPPADKVQSLKVIEGGGSTSSIGSSVFDCSKSNVADKASKKHEAWDVSEDDISDILK
uniref:C2H2-type domain-containing protein n=1 Tax=Photinus pyralis TaxID=7054 RepID=A0A1Y1LH74_PHOPY